MTTSATIEHLAAQAKSATSELAGLSTAQKNAALKRVVDQLANAATRESILQANAKDLEGAVAKGLSDAMCDRLRLDAGRLDNVAQQIQAIIALPDPVGDVQALRTLANGLQVGQMRVPLGLICMIYESRPNVTSDAAALCLKSGNAVILRGGSEAFQSNQAIASVYTQALEAEGVPSAAITFLPTTDREALHQLLQLDGVIDLVIPRGGESLIRMVTETARMPVIQHYKGVCHVYVDEDCDPTMAVNIAVNAKTHRTGVCNAMETLLVDSAIASSFVPRIVEELSAQGVIIRGDAQACELASAAIEQAGDEDWGTEYLDSIVSLAVVDGIDDALAHVQRYGSQHTESIVTNNYFKAQRWVREVDASCVLVNASTRFNDGFELGLGAEIGISTSKMHAYGPMGLNELCTYKWVAYGEGQVRL